MNTDSPTNDDFPDVLSVALLGYGGIGRLHALAYGQLPYLYPAGGIRPELRWVYTSRAETARRAVAETGAPHGGTDLDAVLADPAVDAVDVTLPNHLHVPTVMRALEAGKHVYCEKPLAATLSDAERLQDAVHGASGVFAMTFQYRFLPALLRARALLEAGAIGRVFTFRAEYLHSGYQDPARPLSWRMRKDQGGSGALGDLGSHVVDLVHYLMGGIEAVQGHLETFIPRRPVAKGSDETGDVTVDDVAWLRARLVSGGVGTIEASRFATGTLDDLRLWIHGEGGALHFSLMDPNFLWYFDAGKAGGEYGGEQGWQRLHAVQQYPGAAAPPGRAPIGWDRAHAENQYRFLRAVRHAQETLASSPRNTTVPEAAARPTPDDHIADRALPGLADGLAVQRVLDATERSHAAGGAWMNVAAPGVGALES